MTRAGEFLSFGCLLATPCMTVLKSSSITMDTSSLVVLNLSAWNRQSRQSPSAAVAMAARLGWLTTVDMRLHRTGRMMARQSGNLNSSL